MINRIGSLKSYRVGGEDEFRIQKILWGVACFSQILCYVLLIFVYEQLNAAKKNEESDKQVDIANIGFLVISIAGVGSSLMNGSTFGELGRLCDPGLTAAMSAGAGAAGVLTGILGFLTATGQSLLANEIYIGIVITGVSVSFEAGRRVLFLPLDPVKVGSEEFKEADNTSDGKLKGKNKNKNKVVGVSDEKDGLNQTPSPKKSKSKKEDDMKDNHTGASPGPTNGDHNKIMLSSSTTTSNKSESPGPDSDSKNTVNMDSQKKAGTARGLRKGLDSEESDSDDSRSADGDLPLNPILAKEDATTVPSNSTSSDSTKDNLNPYLQSKPHPLTLALPALLAMFLNNVTTCLVWPAYPNKLKPAVKADSGTRCNSMFDPTSEDGVKLFRTVLLGVLPLVDVIGRLNPGILAGMGAFRKKTSSTSDSPAGTNHNDIKKSESEYYYDEELGQMQPLLLDNVDRSASQSPTVSRSLDINSTSPNINSQTIVVHTTAFESDAESENNSEEEEKKDENDVSQPSTWALVVQHQVKLFTVLVLLRSVFIGLLTIAVFGEIGRFESSPFWGSFAASINSSDANRIGLVCCMALVGGAITSFSMILGPLSLVQPEEEKEREKEIEKEIAGLRGERKKKDLELELEAMRAAEEERKEWRPIVGTITSMLVVTGLLTGALLSKAILPS